MPRPGRNAPAGRPLRRQRHHPGARPPPGNRVPGKRFEASCGVGEPIRSHSAPFLLAIIRMATPERRAIPRSGPGRRGPALRREVEALKQRSSEILLRLDELVRELEHVRREVRRDQATGKK
jgi:hypothetical protein